MKSFQQKKEELAVLADKLSKAKIAVFTSFAREGEKGLNVKDMGALKKDLRSVDSEYLVEKKTLLDKVLKESPSTTLGAGKKEIDVFAYPGSLGVVFGYGDSMAAAKSVYGFARKNPALKYFGAFWEGKFLDFEGFTEFAKMPSREVLIARLLGMMKYPITALAQVLKQIEQKK